MSIVLLGDCLDIMHGYSDNQFDLIITDPPYGIGEDSFRVANRAKLAKTTDYGPFDWDKKLSREYFTEMLRVSKNQVIFGGNYYADWLPPSSCWIVWDKDNTAGFADCELAWTSFNTAVRKFTHRWNGMIQHDMKNKELRYHPTQKPLRLMRFCISKYANEGDSILDPFMGSGTTLRAAKDLGFDCVGIDNNPVYVEIARERLKQEVLL